MVVFVVLLSISLASGLDYPRRCLLFKKSCVAHCPRTMHPYHTRCDKDTLSQRTCSSPFTYTIGYTCGWSRCDCNGGTLLDEETNSCVKPEQCPVYKFRKARRRKKKADKLPKEIIVDDQDLIDMRK